jgi:hypothetical protein
MTPSGIEPGDLLACSAVPQPTAPPRAPGYDSSLQFLQQYFTDLWPEQDEYSPCSFILLMYCSPIYNYVFKDISSGFRITFCVVLHYMCIIRGQTNSKCIETSYSWKANSLFARQIIPSILRKPADCLLCIQEIATDPYPDSNGSSAHTYPNPWRSICLLFYTYA